MAIGAALRQAREQHGLSLDDISRVTRIQPRFLEALEQEAYSRLPPRPYIRGMVAAYAREVGLDSGEAVRDYCADLDLREAQAPASPPDGPSDSVADKSSRFRPAPLAIGAVLAIGVVVAWNLPTRAPTPGPQAVGTAGFGQPVAAVSAAGNPATADPGTPDSADLAIVLEASGPSWVAASTDGTRVVYRVLQPGERETLRARREIAMRIGNAGGISWTVNGQERGTMGKAGEVRDVMLSKENAATVR